MKKLIVLSAILLLTGCSTKFVYKNVDWLVHWYVDDYIDMNKDQKQMFDEYVVQWKNWHMQNELPKYKAHLEELAQDIASQNVSIDRMGYHQEKAREHWSRFLEHISTGVAKIASTRHDAQNTDFFAASEQENIQAQTAYYGGHVQR